jgi:hypothetical protein
MTLVIAPMELEYLFCRINAKRGNLAHSGPSCARGDDTCYPHHDQHPRGCTAGWVHTIKSVAQADPYKGRGGGFLPNPLDRSPSWPSTAEARVCVVISPATSNPTTLTDCGLSEVRRWFLSVFLVVPSRGGSWGEPGGWLGEHVLIGTPPKSAGAVVARPRLTQPSLLTTRRLQPGS